MNSEKLKVIVVDDEDDIRKTLVSTLNESPEMQVVGEADSVNTAFALLDNTACDALFLDIKLKGGDAFRLLRLLERQAIDIPPVIINTGFAEFEYVQKAHNEFGDKVVMILKKPFWEDWAEKENRILLKVRERLSETVTEEVSSIKNGRIVIKQGHKTLFIAPDRLMLIETDLRSKGRGIVLIHTPENVHRVSRSLRSFAAELTEQFLRVSRYALVNLNYIESIDHKMQCLRLRGYDSYVNIGDSYKAEVLRRLGE